VDYWNYAESLFAYNLLFYPFANSYDAFLIGYDLMFSAFPIFPLLQPMMKILRIWSDVVVLAVYIQIDTNRVQRLLFG
jgi:hypothetical protein